ncbi:MAG: LytR/AlgR family response regulator transcription factor [Ignavibacteriales bacterium]
MLEVLILEDEEYTRRYIESMVSEHPMVKHVTGTGAGREAVQLAQNLRPDIVFLDIELGPDDCYTGLEVAVHIAELCPKSKLIFLTGYARYALDSFVVHPYDYIVKPVTQDRMFELLTGLAKEKRPVKNNGQKKIVIRSKDGLVFLTIGEIFFFEKQGKKVFVHTRVGAFETGYNLTELEGLVPVEFLRTHKAFIINTSKIRHMQDVGNRSWEIFFHGYDRPALMSRYKYEDHREIFTPSF